jgi:acyl-CoA reductase-like NAD-dependent aldehyde dehydrogenase
MAAWKIAPALACGNTVVLKPAETTPLTALLLCEVFQQAELPPGVVNIITGDGQTGAWLVQHPDLDKIAFTGSTEVGKKIQKAVAGTRKRLTLELGGKAANVIFEDADIDQAIEGIVNGIYFNQGHVCCAGSRLLVEESIYEVVVRKLKRRIELLRVGDPLDKNTDVGAINSLMQLRKIEHLVRVGIEEGAEIHQSSCPLPERGYWFRPTFFTRVSMAHTIAREEIFGPVLAILTFRTPDEAAEIANNTRYGLSAGVWTNKGSKYLAFASRLKAGVVWCNTYNKFDPASPFGGYKESGFGARGRHPRLKRVCRAGVKSYANGWRAGRSSDFSPPADGVALLRHGRQIGRCARAPPVSRVGETKQAARGVECRNNLNQIRAAIQMRQGSEESLPASLQELGLSASMLACPESGQPYQYDPTSGTVRCPTPGHGSY